MRLGDKTAAIHRREGESRLPISKENRWRPSAAPIAIPARDNARDDQRYPLRTVNVTGLL